VSDTDLRIEPILSDTDDGDHDRFSHVVKRSDANRGYMGGEAIVALCGKRWVPSRDPERYPVCPDCKRALEEMR
jgi:hypothetical protein